MITPDYLTNRMYHQSIAVLFAMLLINTWAAKAQTTTPPNPADKPATNNATGTTNPTEPAKSTAAPTPYVKAVTVNGESAGLNDNITVTIANLDEEIARQQAPNSGVPPEQRLDPYKYVLFLDGIEMKGLNPFRVGPDGALQFKLTRNPDNSGAWLNFLGRPSDSIKKVKASVGLTGKPPLEGKEFTLRLYNQKLFYFATVLFLAAFIGFLIAAWTTPIIRDSGPPNPVNGPLTRPFSLGRTQMAWWFFIVLGSFLFITLVTWDLNTITSQSLVLMGIGAGTALGAAMVDANKRMSSSNDLHTLMPKEAQLAALITDLNSKIADAEAKLAAGPDDEALKTNLSAWQIELATKQEELEQIKSQLEDAVSEQQRPVTAGPITDLLSDANGVTFHRFQILVWTIVLGLVFLYTVWTTLAMPQFSDTLLALMGISAGTYIGFKIPEKQTDANDAAAAAGNVAGGNVGG